MDGVLIQIQIIANVLINNKNRKIAISNTQNSKKVKMACACVCYGKQSKITKSEKTALA